MLEREIGFNQELALKLGMDLVDIWILKDFAFFRGSDMTKTIYENGDVYYWFNYKTFIEKHPITGINSKVVLRRRMKRLVDVDVLKYKLVQQDGNFTYYALGENYWRLVEEKNIPMSKALTEKLKGVMDVNQEVKRVLTDELRGFNSTVKTKSNNRDKDKKINNYYYYTDNTKDIEEDIEIYNPSSSGGGSGGSDKKFFEEEFYRGTKVQSSVVFNVVNIAERRNIVLSPVQIDSIAAYIEIYGEGEVLKALEIADNSGKRNLNYVKGILDRRRSDGTNGEVTAEEQARREKEFIEWQKQNGLYVESDEPF